MHLDFNMHVLFFKFDRKMSEVLYTPLTKKIYNKQNTTATIKNHETKSLICAFLHFFNIFFCDKDLQYTLRVICICGLYSATGCAAEQVQVFPLSCFKAIKRIV